MASSYRSSGDGEAGTRPVSGSKTIEDEWGRVVTGACSILPLLDGWIRGSGIESGFQNSSTPPSVELMESSTIVVREVP